MIYIWSCFLILLKHVSIGKNKNYIKKTFFLGLLHGFLYRITKATIPQINSHSSNSTIHNKTTANKRIIVQNLLLLSFLFVWSAFVFVPVFVLLAGVDSNVAFFLGLNFAWAFPLLVALALAFAFGSGSLAPDSRASSFVFWFAISSWLSAASVPVGSATVAFASSGSIAEMAICR